MFEFKFEKLLKIKEKLLEDKKMRIASLEKQILTLRENKSELEATANGLRKRIFEILRSSRPDRNMIIFLSEQATHCDESTKELEKKIEDLFMQKKRLTEEAKELMIEKKKLERLREKKFEEYVLEFSREEKRFLDEVNSVKIASNINRIY